MKKKKLEENVDTLDYKLKMLCGFCGHKWLTRTKLLMVSCPSCGLKNKVKR